MLFHDEFERISKREDNVVYHDELSPNFLPVYFSDFVERAERQGLQFLSEAPLADMADPVGNPEALAALSQYAGGDLVAYQQCLDFVRLRRFRQTLLCHREIPLCRDRLAERLRGLLVASPMSVSAEKADGVVEFVNEREPGRVETNNPILVASLRRLEQIWPRAERFADLVGAVCPQILKSQQTEAIVGLAQAMLKLAASTLADLRSHRLPLAKNVGERPTASLLARLEAQQSSQVTTLLHTQVNIEDEQGRRFLQLLDGTRDRQALTDAVALEHPQISRDSILRQVESNLTKVYRMGLLVA
jgi:methyltransferase-like protein